MRKLAIAAFSFSAAVFAANTVFSRNTVLYAALVCALAGAAVLGVRLKSLRALVIGCFAAAIGFAVFATHYDLTVSKAHHIAAEKRELSFVLLEKPQKREGYSSVEVRLETPGLPKLKCILYGEENEMDMLRGGDLIRTEIKLSASDIRYGEHTDRYTSKDVYLTGTLKGEIQKLGSKHTIASISSAAADVIARRMDGLFDRSAAPFIKALMIGEKSELYRDDALYVSLSRAGLMHVAAVSGMHVSYLIAFLRFLFGKGKRSAILCILLAWAFVAVSGMTPSALRAAFMQTMLLLAPLVNRENDAVTSLAFALSVLLFINPFAAGNVSLQLSFSAMLGIVLFFDRMQELLMRPFGEGRAARILRVPVGVISCTLSVMAVSLPISAAYFGYVSLLSPLTNLLCFWAVPICFIGSFAALGLSWIPFLAKLIAAVVTGLVRYMISVCDFISSLDYSVIYLPDRLRLLWALLFYASLAAVFFFKLKPRKKLLVPIAAALVGLLLPHVLLGCYYRSARETITAIDVGQGQCISVMCGEHAVVIDCGSTSYAEYDAGDCAGAYLRSCGMQEIDAVVFTHLHEDHANGYERLANLMEIDKLILPANVDRTDTLLWEILACAQRHGTEIEFVGKDTLRRYGDIRLFLFAAESGGEGNERCMPVIATVDDYDVIITGDAPADRERKLVGKADLEEIEALVVGHHGSKSASCEEYLRAVAGDKAIVSVGKNYYGMPAPEVLERLKSFGYTVCRTDLEGNVEIRVDG